MPRPRRTSFALLLVLALAATGCGGVGSTGDKGYVDGTGVITLLDEAKREKPGPVSGTTLEGDEVSLAAYAGKVVVINVWGSWCPPCRSEADDLVVAAEELMPRGVVFLGINTRDNSAETALAFEKARGVPYPSIFDPGGRNLLAFYRTLSPNAIPSTVVVDAQGRVAASVIGELTSARTLVALVEDVIG
jgi:thiol-disulfide isomerase/thioredoxin